MGARIHRTDVYEVHTDEMATDKSPEVLPTSTRSNCHWRCSMTPTDEIITVAQVAEILKCRPSSVYNLTRKRGLARYAHPLPVIRLPLGLRFKRSSILKWLDDIEERPEPVRCVS